MTPGAARTPGHDGSDDDRPVAPIRPSDRPRQPPTGRRLICRCAGEASVVLTAESPLRPYTAGSMILTRCTPSGWTSAPSGQCSPGSNVEDHDSVSAGRPAQEGCKQRGSTHLQSVLPSGIRTGHPPPGRSAVSKGRDRLLLGSRVVLGGGPPGRPAPARRARRAAPAAANLAMVLWTAPPTSADEGAEPDDPDGTTEAASR